MIVALTAKNKLGFIDNSIDQPRSDDLLYGSWTRCNSMVISWILNSVTRDIADSLMYMPTAREMWIDLHDRFHESNAPRVYQIKKMLNGLQQGSMDISSYYTKLRILWDELRDYQPTSVCNCGSMREWVAYQNQECVMHFLMGLNESYAQIRAQVLMMEPLPIISKVFALVVQEERQRSIHHGVTKMSIDHSVSLNSVTSTTGPRLSKAGRGDKVVCSHCHFRNHTVDKCYKLHGYPPGHPKLKQQLSQGNAQAHQISINMQDHLNTPGDNLTQSQCKQLIEFLSSKLQIGHNLHVEPQQQEPTISCLTGICSTVSHTSSITQTDWVLDTGATHHICCSLSMFHSVRPVSSKIMLPNTLTIQVSVIGSVFLTSDLILHDVLYVPEFQFNLLSISALTNNRECSVSFTANSCQIQDIKRTKMIGTGKRLGNLYVLMKSTSYVCNASVPKSELWHLRMGHPSPSKLSSLKDILHFDSNNVDVHPCHVCHLSKQKRLPFKSNNKMVDHPFELLHIDVWGPFSQYSVDGYRFFLTIVDDHTRFTWVYLLRSKSDVSSIFPMFCRMVDTQFGAKIKSVRSDNAPELGFIDFFKELGIVHTYSCVERPQQNSVVERKHQHILNVARALMFQSHIPIGLNLKE
ncbi:hypothetical protein F511_38248 [Dorcoceras hygrometricum]|uniref:Integrase catalytic domain-containing protein n=1 Tax=Dorcoceras hygrometricum TaxID=472368 RepID=A0A2Z7BSS5_9LAMI|nr:hypothetical protein F511_38248 [Dorcoceras hygrometricum]